jgi:hypothetical protein
MTVKRKEILGILMQKFNQLRIEEINYTIQIQMCLFPIKDPLRARSLQ